MNSKYKYLCIIIIIILFSCETKEITEEKKGFRYKVPPGMREAPEEAYKYKYNNLIIEENIDVRNSTILIALRHAEIKNNTTLNDFVENDQSTGTYCAYFNKRSGISVILEIAYVLPA